MLVSSKHFRHDCVDPNPVIALTLTAGRSCQRSVHPGNWEYPPSAGSHRHEAWWYSQFQENRVAFETLRQSRQWKYLAGFSWKLL